MRGTMTGVRRGTLLLVGLALTSACSDGPPAREALPSTPQVSVGPTTGPATGAPPAASATPKAVRAEASSLASKPPTRTEGDPDCTDRSQFYSDADYSVYCEFYDSSTGQFLYPEDYWWYYTDEYAEGSGTPTDASGPSTSAPTSLAPPTQVPPTEEPPAPTTEPPAPTEEPPAPTEEPPAPTEEPPAPTEEPPAPTEEPPAPTEEPPAPTDGATG